MSDYKRLRDTLYWLLNLHHGVGKNGGPPSDEEWNEALVEGMTVIAETSHSSEMERLRDRIIGRRDSVIRANKGRDFEGWDRGFIDGSLSSLRVVLEYLAEFGYGE